MIRFAGWIAAAAVAAGPAAAEKLQYRLRPGQVIRNRGGIAGAMMAGQPGSPMMRSQFRLRIRQTMKVVSVKDGVVTLEVTDTPVSGYTSTLGRREPYSRTPIRSLVRITERGRFLGRKPLSGGSGEGSLPGADAVFALNFPDRDLKPGDVWEDTFTMGEPSNPQTVHVRSRYEGRAAVLGRSCAKIVTTLTSAMPTADLPEEAAGAAQGRLTATITTYFDPKAGVEVYSTGSYTITARADLSSISADAGEFASVMRVNVVQLLEP